MSGMPAVGRYGQGSRAEQLQDARSERVGIPRRFGQKELQLLYGRGLRLLQRLGTGQLLMFTDSIDRLYSSHHLGQPGETLQAPER